MNSLIKWLNDVFEKDGYRDSVSQYLGDRIGSPFFLSFVISWVVHNYRLVIGPFLWVEADGCGSRFKFLQCLVSELSCWDIILLPLLYSFIAVLFFYLLDTVYKSLRIFFKRKVEPKFVNFVSQGADTVPIDLVNSLYSKNKELEDERFKLRTELNNASELVKMAESKHKESNGQLMLIQDRLSQVSDYDSIKQKLSNAESQIAAMGQLFRTHDTLDSFFNGEWICEFHFVSSVEVVNKIELFKMKNGIYEVRDSDLSYRIEDIMSFSLDFLRFSKLSTATSDTRITHVKLSQVSSKLWIGFELLPTDNIISYVRYYPVNARPSSVVSLFSDSPNAPDDLKILADFKNQFDLL